MLGDVPDPPQSGREGSRARLDGDGEVVVVEQGQHAGVGGRVAEPRKGTLKVRSTLNRQNPRPRLSVKLSLKPRLNRSKWLHCPCHGRPKYDLFLMDPTLNQIFGNNNMSH